MIDFKKNGSGKSNTSSRWKKGLRTWESTKQLLVGQNVPAYILNVKTVLLTKKRVDNCLEWVFKTFEGLSKVKGRRQNVFKGQHRRSSVSPIY
jgi:hypothetical protein